MATPPHQHQRDARVVQGAQGVLPKYLGELRLARLVQDVNNCAAFPRDN